MPLDQRPAFLLRLIPMLQNLRERFGRPHQFVIDECHHLLPKDSDLQIWKSIQGTISITVEPDSVAPDPLRSVDVLVATGDTANLTVERFASAIGGTTPGDSIQTNARGALVCDRRRSAAPIAIEPAEAKNSVLAIAANTRRRNCRRTAASISAVPIKNLIYVPKT